MAKFTKIPVDTFDTIQINAGFITKSFDPDTMTAAPYFATTGGLSFSSNPEYSDFGDDVDNCPKNTKELKRLTAVAPTLSGTAVTVNPELMRAFIGAADSTVQRHVTKITPRYDIDIENDFVDLWFVADYSADNTEETGRFIAIHLINAFNTSGLSWSTSDRGKGTFAFEFAGHVSIANQTQVPFEVYVMQTEDEEVNPNIVGTRTTRKKTEESEA